MTSFAVTLGLLPILPVFAAGYLIGTLPTAQLVAGRHGVDPTVAGSGNPGATNVMRTVGRRAGAATLVGDMGKGAAAAGMGWAAGGRALAILCGTAAVLGHVLPVTRGLRGGKGVATGIGMTVTVFPLIAFAAVFWFATVRGLLGRPSVLSEMGIVLLPVVAAAQGVTVGEVAALSACAGLILFRLWTGRERADDATWRPAPGATRQALEADIGDAEGC